MHRTPDYNEGLCTSQFVGSNFAWARYEEWWELPEMLKSELHITARRTFMAFEKCWQGNLFSVDWGATVFNLYDLGVAYDGVRWQNSAAVYSDIWYIFRLIAKMVFPPWEWPLRRLKGGRFARDHNEREQPTVNFIGDPLSKVHERNIDASACKVEFPNDKSLLTFLGRLRSIAQMRRNNDILESFPIVPMPRIPHQSRYYLGLWPSRNVKGAVRQCEKRKLNCRGVKRVDRNHCKYNG